MNLFAKAHNITNIVCTLIVDLKMCSHSQGEGSLPELNPDFADRARDDHEGPSSHRSYQTAQQQVSNLRFKVKIFTIYLFLCSHFVTNLFPFSLPRVAGGSTWSKMLKEEPVIDYFDVQD